jgi:hypothetical protein
MNNCLTAIFSSIPKQFSEGIFMPQTKVGQNIIFQLNLPMRENEGIKKQL